MRNRPSKPMSAGNAASRIDQATVYRLATPETCAITDFQKASAVTDWPRTDLEQTNLDGERTSFSGIDQTSGGEILPSQDKGKPGNPFSLASHCMQGRRERRRKHRFELHPCKT